MPEYLPCPFCGSQPERKIKGGRLEVFCPQCVSVRFANHVRYGCIADSKWNERADIKEEKKL